MFGRFKKTQLSELVKLSGVYIGPGIIAEGEIKTEDDVFIDSHFKGQIESDGVVEIGKNSNFSGSIKGRSVLIEGITRSEVNASELISFASCAEFRGSATSREVIVPKGALIDAKITTEKN